MFQISRTLFVKEFEFKGNFLDKIEKAKYEVKLWFDFKEGLRFSCSMPDYSYCTRNPFKAILGTLEHSIVGHVKYQHLKSKVRSKGFARHL